MNISTIIFREKVIQLNITTHSFVPIHKTSQANQRSPLQTANLAAQDGSRIIGNCRDFKMRLRIILDLFRLIKAEIRRA